MIRLLIFGLVRVGRSVSAPPAQTTVVVELFTSEGCSSCPPADQVLSRLESPRNPAIVRGKQASISVPRGVEVIALGEHVDYWDQLGWKDKFSSPLFRHASRITERRFISKASTLPQIVVNGQKEVLGSDSRAVQDAIGKAAKEPQAQVTIAMTSPQTFPSACPSCRPEATKPKSCWASPKADSSLLFLAGKTADANCATPPWSAVSAAWAGWIRTVLENTPLWRSSICVRNGIARI